MIQRMIQVATRIRSEISDLEVILGRIMDGLEKAKRSGDFFYLDGVALNLHGLFRIGKNF